VTPVPRMDGRRLARGLPALALGIALILGANPHSRAAPAGSDRTHGTRSQVDTVGFATRWSDMEALLAACRREEGATLATPSDDGDGNKAGGWAVAVMPHDDYLYAGRVYVHLLPGLRAPRWLIFGVCHACRRQGIRDRLIFDDFENWRVAGESFPVDAELRAELLEMLPVTEATIDSGRHADEHSIEALLPWLRTAQPQATFVPILVTGMSWPRMQELADSLASAMTEICRRNQWLPGRDIGILVSADAVHYGCEDWGSRPYDPFGCDEKGHAAAVARDRTLAEATLCGRLGDDGLFRFISMVWNPDLSQHAENPYRITWCGLYSIPLGLATAWRLQAALDQPALNGYLLRYGDSYSDGRLQLPETKLGVTAPNHVRHWVGYAALGWTAGR
jgi:AmmeMemoRadiSam system protein B